MTENEKLVRAMTDYEVKIVAEGLSIVLNLDIEPTRAIVTAILNDLSANYGGTGLVTVMDALRNN